MEFNSRETQKDILTTNSEYAGPILKFSRGILPGLPSASMRAITLLFVGFESYCTRDPGLCQRKSPFFRIPEAVFQTKAARGICRGGLGSGKRNQSIFLTMTMLISRPRMLTRTSSATRETTDFSSSSQASFAPSLFSFTERITSSRYISRDQHKLDW